MEGHFHAGALTILHVAAIMVIVNFLARSWSGLRASNPAAQGLAFVL
jgi:hypothetical protein